MLYLVLFIILLGTSFRFGYQFGTLDHVILSLRGIADADPRAFQNDWFLLNSPQPHWLFDLYTQWGESLHILREFYFSYWLVSSAIFAWALMLFCKYLKIEKYAWLIALLMILEPIRILGSGPFIASWALPHFLGGSLALLTCALWVHGYGWCLWFLVPLTTLVHTQHGALLSLLVFLSSLFTLRKHWKFAVLALANVILVYATARMRGVTEDGETFLKLCKDVIPGHCFAPKWPVDWLLPLVTFVVAGAFYLPKLVKRQWDLWCLLVLAALSITTLGTLIDYLDIEPLASIYRRLFMHRMTGYSVFFSTVVLVLILASPGWRNPRHLAAKFFSILGLIAIFATDASIFREETPVLNAGKNGPLLERAGNMIQILIPSGETILMDPKLIWMRYVSRRAVVADLKAIPYQGNAFLGWQERFSDLGGPSGLDSISFEKLVLNMKKYKSRFVVLKKTDPKNQEATKKFRAIAHFLEEYVLYEVDEKAFENL